MTTVVDGRKLAGQIQAEVRTAVDALTGIPPGLATIQVGADPASTVYVRNKHRACQKSGIYSQKIELPDDTSEARVLDEISRLNEDPAIHGILVQLPLPAGIDPARVAEQILPEKDVDGLHPRNAGALLAGQPGLVPCTPRGCLAILDRHGVDLEGARAVVLGRSEIVGKPVALLLLHRNATVTVCHSRTRHLPDVVREADVVIAAVGRPGMVRGDWVQEGAAVIDVGVNRLPDGKLCGDVCFDELVGRASLLTPVPGGVGPLTVGMLMVNTLEARQRSGRG